MSDEPVTGTTDERAAEGMDHLQTAAREMIDAARAFLDVAEEYIEDRDRLGRAAEVVGRVADAAGRTAREAAGLVGVDGTSVDGVATEAASGDDAQSRRVQHIPVD